MSDAAVATNRTCRCQKPESPLVNRQAFLDAFNAKGAKTGAERAELLGVTRRSVERYLNGDVIPLVTRAQHIAHRLDRPVGDLWNAA